MTCLPLRIFIYVKLLVLPSTKLFTRDHFRSQKEVVNAPFMLHFSRCFPFLRSIDSCPEEGEKRYIRLMRHTQTEPHHVVRLQMLDITYLQHHCEEAHSPQEEERHSYTLRYPHHF